MATGKSGAAGGQYRERQPSRWVRNFVLLLALVVLFALAFTWQSLRQEALASTSYGARVVCACRFVSGLPMDECKGGMAIAGLGRTAELVMFSEDDERHTVTARVPLLAAQSATYDNRDGCQLQPWKD